MIKAVIIGALALLALIVSQAAARPSIVDYTGVAIANGTSSKRCGTDSDNMPPGVAAGDIIWVRADLSGADGISFSMPSPLWTSFDANDGHVVGSDANSIQYHSWWTVYPGAGGFSDAEATVTFSGATPSGSAGGCQMMIVRGTNTSDPIEQSVVQTYATNVQLEPVGGITTNSPDPLVMAVSLQSGSFVASMSLDVGAPWGDWFTGNNINNYAHGYKHATFVGPVAVSQVNVKSTPTRAIVRGSMWAFISGSPTVTPTPPASNTPTPTPTGTPTVTPTSTSANTATVTPTHPLVCCEFAWNPGAGTPTPTPQGGSSFVYCYQGNFACAPGQIETYWNGDHCSGNTSTACVGADDAAKDAYCTGLGFGTCLRGSMSPQVLSETSDELCNPHGGATPALGQCSAATRTPTRTSTPTPTHTPVSASGCCASAAGETNYCYELDAGDICQDVVNGGGTFYAGYVCVASPGPLDGLNPVTGECASPTPTPEPTQTPEPTGTPVAAVALNPRDTDGIARNALTIRGVEGRAALILPVGDVDDPQAGDIWINDACALCVKAAPWAPCFEGD